MWKTCPFRRVPWVPTLFWGAVCGLPQDSTVPEDFQQLLRLSKSWDPAHPELEKCHLTRPLRTVCGSVDYIWAHMSSTQLLQCSGCVCSYVSLRWSSVSYRRSFLELTRPLKTKCELMPVQCWETVEFLQLTCSHLNPTLWPNDGDSLKATVENQRDGGWTICTHCPRISTVAQTIKIKRSSSSRIWKVQTHTSP